METTPERSSGHTPTTGQVRSRFSTQAGAPDGVNPEWGLEFDRWLAAHDAEVAANAWEEGHDTGRDDAFFELRGLSTDSDADQYPHANPYRAAAIRSTVDND